MPNKPARKNFARGTAGLCLTLALLCGLLTACGGQTKPAESGGDSIEPVLSDWMNYVAVCEQLYEDLDWASSYAGAFAAAPSWEALLQAQAAVELAAKRTALRQPPEPSATADLYARLVEQGADVTFVRPEIDSFEKTRQEMLQTIELLRTELQSDVFTADGIPRLAEELALREREDACVLRDLALSSEYLLLELGDAEWTEKFREALALHCPRINAMRDDSLTGKEELEEAATQNLDELSALLEELALLTGRNQANLDLLREYIRLEDWDALTAACSGIEGLPLLLPSPGWDGQSGVFFWNEADGSRRYLTDREEMAGPPDGCVLEYAGVDEAALSGYLERLERLGLSGLRKERDGGGYDVYYQVGDSAFVFSWTEEKAVVSMLEHPVCFAPEWYLACRP